MAQHQAEDHHTALVEKMLHTGGFSHLRARKRGNAIIVESGPQSDPMKHLRLRRDSAQLWGLDIADHRDRWERTPYRQQLEDLVQLVIDDFPWTLAGAF